jgi:hypothetical protein
MVAGPNRRRHGRGRAAPVLLAGFLAFGAMLVLVLVGSQFLHAASTSAASMPPQQQLLQHGRGAAALERKKEEEEEEACPDRPTWRRFASWDDWER